MSEEVLLSSFSHPSVCHRLCVVAVSLEQEPVFTWPAMSWITQFVWLKANLYFSNFSIFSCFLGKGSGGAKEALRRVGRR